jgi:uncharacterized protein (TIGR02271 family)
VERTVDPHDDEIQEETTDGVDDLEVVPVVEETLRVEARAVPTGRVIVRKQVSVADEVIDLPLAREEVSIERIPRGELVDAPPPVREEGGATIVPVLEEVLVVEKRLRLREELRITRRRREERHVRRVALRREDVTVERAASGGVGAAGGQARLEEEEDQIMNRDLQCIIGLFDRREDAMAAQQELIGNGIEAGSIQLSEQAGAAAQEKGFWTRLKEAFGAEDASAYGEATRRGGTLLEVDDLSPTQVDLCAGILERHGAVDIDQRMGELRQGAQTTGLGATGLTGEALAGAGRTEETIPVTEERLKVGKRQERRGGVRVFSRVLEQPVSEDVTLRDEQVHVERRRVDRPAEAGAFEERSIELTELHEEPVVSKEARVVEEVVVGKDVAEHTETIEDTVRKIEVDVQDLEVDFRRDYEDRYASSGVSFDEVRPAYDYGRELAEHAPDRTASWQTIEPQARDDFERRNPGMWNRYSDAVRRGYERSLARR